MNDMPIPNYHNFIALPHPNRLTYLTDTITDIEPHFGHLYNHIVQNVGAYHPHAIEIATQRSRLQLYRQQAAANQLQGPLLASFHNVRNACIKYNEIHPVYPPPAPPSPSDPNLTDSSSDVSND
ncbi:MAG: hypothetical protein K2W99_06080 [Chthoniobacterales bacterium]|nr:hypothetical protein [Chthoniobacterales bacterium]